MALLRDHRKNEILDLGAVEPPLMVFGGPYGNLQAARAVREEAESRGLSPAQILCTGDIVAYCGAPAETAAVVRDWGITVVRGNVEEQVGAGADHCGCGFDDGSACDTLARDWYARCVAALDPATARWMGARPRIVRFVVDGLRLAAFHAAADSMSRFVFPSTPLADKARQIANLGADVVIAGHSGIPFVQDVGHGLWLNAGVIGMPGNDGTPDGWYAMIERGAGGLAVSLHRLDYDHCAAAAEMRQRGYPEGYARALGTGLWPSLDILPAAEREEAGRPLSPRSVAITSRTRVA